MSFIDFAMGKRSSHTNDQMNESASRLAWTQPIGRAVISTTGWCPTTTFMGWGSPDFCMLVEPDKNQRTAWKGKAWELAGEHMILTCQPHLRRGLIFALRLSLH